MEIATVEFKTYSITLQLSVLVIKYLPCALCGLEVHSLLRQHAYIPIVNVIHSVKCILESN